MSLVYTRFYYCWYGHTGTTEGTEVCENRIIFTEPGTYIATAILLDPIVTSCNLRFSFEIKVRSSHRENQVHKPRSYFTGDRA